MTPRPIALAGLAFGVAVLLAACSGAGSTAIPPTASVLTSAAASASSPATPSVSASAAASASASSAGAPRTPSCVAPATTTPAQTEGPYYKAGAPETASLVESGMAGTPVTLTGWVVTTDCTPLAGAKVEIWQADASGAYDDTGYRLRGYVLTDATGRFTIETIVPGEYPGRTEHLHVKVTPAGGSTLTTQLYFPGVQANDGDGIYDPALLLAMSDSSSGLTATYTFVVAA